jgi:phosphate starvation-inducible membrane PsiE
MQHLLTQAEKLAEKGETFAEKVGNYLVDGFQLLALFVIGATIVWSAADAYLGLLDKRSAAVDDILLLFIFLELGAMVGIYFKTNRLPVQFLLYVAITVLTRSLASSVSVKALPDERLVAITGSILLLAVAVFILRYASNKFPPFVSHVESDDPQGSSKVKDAG